MQILKDKNRKKEYDEMRKKGADEFAGYLYDEICPICHIFGSGDNSSKVMFRDMKVIEDSFTNCEIRSGISIDRDLNITNDGALFEVEIVPPGTQFEFMMIADNLTKSEWMYLKYALKAMENGDIDIGGLKSRGLGQVKLIGEEGQDVVGKYINKENLKEYILRPDNIDKMALGEISIGG